MLLGLAPILMFIDIFKFFGMNHDDLLSHIEQENILVGSISTMSNDQTYE